MFQPFNRSLFSSMEKYDSSLNITCLSVGRLESTAWTVTSSKILFVRFKIYFTKL